MEDSIKHIIKTTEQWNLTANQYKIIECGCLCVELCPDKTTKIKVGEGNKNYAQLPYISGTEADLSNYYTKAEVDRITNNLNRMKIASTEEYDSEHSLPLRGNNLGDVRFVKSPDPSVSTDPIEYLWNGNKWIYLGGMMFDVDLSDYVKREEIMPRVDVLERMAHTHQNKDILDHTEKPYTTKDKEKLDKLHNYDDTEVKQRITDLEKIDDFKGATSYRDGTSGYVPKPKRSDRTKFLRGDGKWVDVDTEIPVASETTLGGIKVGENLSIDENGVLSATGEGPEYTAGDGINIDDQDNEISVKIGSGLAFDENGAITTTPYAYVRVSTSDSFVLLHTKPADWDTDWDRYYRLSYDILPGTPPDWDPTKHYKYEDDNYVLGSPGDTFASTTWYDKHYIGLDPNTPVIFDSDVYYTGDLRLITDGESFDTAFEKLNEAIDHVGRIESAIEYLKDDKVGVRPGSTPEQIEFYKR